MPYKDAERRRAYARQYAKHHPQCVHESPEARERRLLRLREYAKTDRGKESLRRGQAKHRTTAKGIASAKKATKKYLAGPKAALRWQRYNARKTANGGNVSSDDWAMVLDMYTDHRGTICAYCYEIIDKPAMDHIVPISRGGGHFVENIAPVCKSCNSSKGAKTLLSWLLYCQLPEAA